MKKHRACVSEFDYSGWEELGRWKRITSGQAVRSGSKHCEDECDFPSSCHWKGKHAVQEIGAKFLDPGCLDKEPDVSSAKGKFTTQESTGDYIGKLRKAAEKRAVQVAKAVLPPIEEEDHKSPVSLDRSQTLSGLGLHFPVMDFSSPRKGASESCELEDKPQMLLIPKAPQLSARVDNVWEDDVDMTDWITQDATESPPTSPCRQRDAIEVSFDFGLGQDNGLAASLADDSPTSPMRSTWDWTAGGIGVALSPATDEIWGEEMEDEIDDTDMLWDKGGDHEAG